MDSPNEPWAAHREPLGPSGSPRSVQHRIHGLGDEDAVEPLQQRVAVGGQHALAHAVARRAKLALDQAQHGGCLTEALALLDVTVDEGLHDRISIGCLLQQFADGWLVDPLGTLDEVAQQGFQHWSAVQCSAQLLCSNSR
jgi:hypothetical protein